MWEQEIEDYFMEKELSRYSMGSAVVPSPTLCPLCRLVQPGVSPQLPVMTPVPLRGVGVLLESREREVC